MFSIFNSASSHTSSKSRYISHTLMRRYVLTLTAYKFLDIEIVVGPTSHVEIAISDNRGNRIILPHATWKASIERCTDIERLMQSTSFAPSSVRDLMIEIVKMRNMNVVKLSLREICLYMKP
ncbi:hypothetical protein ALC53_04414 [Atta colombica]|uniref:Uncharacterized protein n=1 Tax=Atta colombica TaxID=520822 RepID=A0A195BLN4_9HYME|nr:hypothetical protein ALC53_04414 [Atta colombica]